MIVPDDDRLEALAEFAAGAGHEINNPLASIVGRAQLLLQDERDPARRDALATIVAQALRVRDMIGDVMLLARPPQPKPQSLALAVAVEAVIDRLNSDCQQAGVTVTASIDGQLHVSADPTQLAVVVAELLRNAVRAARTTGGAIRITACAGDGDVTLLVEDDGVGFSEAERRHAFDPFFSGRQAGRGLGFGLCKVWSIVRQHNGRIEIESAATGPTRVAVTWPGVVAR